MNGFIGNVPNVTMVKMESGGTQSTLGQIKNPDVQYVDIIILMGHIIRLLEDQP